MCKFDKKGKGRRLDECMRNLIAMLSGMLDSNYRTVASCCGHGKYPMSIIIRNCLGGYFELFSGTPIMRIRRFYRRDSEGIYYIPELIYANSFTLLPQSVNAISIKAQNISPKTCPINHGVARQLSKDGYCQDCGDYPVT